MNATTKSTERVTLSIDGMSCGHCVRTVTEALSGVPSVKVYSVAVGSAEIDASDPNAANDAIAALGNAGYQATVARRAAVASPARVGGCCGGPKGCCG
ncbi:MAG: heavy-metal-associated domain-containing protein [Planctomycetes bacterium]|nr:heavy-metal-associated domain-containing protein [Planctomycetota bacterium]